MRRGELYRVRKPGSRDPKKCRVFVVVSRQVLIDSRFATVICAPVYSSCEGLSTQVPLGIEDGLKQECSIHCDELVSLLKVNLQDYVGMLSPGKRRDLNRALCVALNLEEQIPF